MLKKTIGFHKLTFLLGNALLAFSLIVAIPHVNALESNLVQADSSPVIFSRSVHSNADMKNLEKEKYRILASMYFWQTDAKKLAIFKPDLNSFNAVDAYPFTPFSVDQSGRYYTIGGACTAPFAGMSNCPDVIYGKVGSATFRNIPSPGFLDNHELIVDSAGNFWAIRYLVHQAHYFKDFLQNSPKSASSSAEIQSDRIVDCEVIKFNKSGKVLFRWSALQELPESEIRGPIWNPNPTGIVKTGYDGLVYEDVFHCNSLDVAPSGDKFLISARHTDSIYEVDTKTKKVIWKIGGNKLPSKSLTLVTQNGGKIDSRSVLGGPHDARYVSSSQVTVYDNSTNYSRPARGLLFSLDKKGGKAILSSVFNDPTGSNSGCTGSFRKVSGNKNWFIAGWGCTKSGITIFNSIGRAVVSLKVADLSLNDEFRPKIPISNTESMISYRVTPHYFEGPMDFDIKRSESN